MKSREAEELRQSEHFRQFIIDYFGENSEVVDMTDDEVLYMTEEYENYCQWHKENK